MTSEVKIIAQVISLKGRKPQVIDDKKEIYIGRNIFMGGWKLKKSKWANPFPILDAKDDTERNAVLDKCKTYVKEGPLYNDLEELEGKILCCWCHNKCSKKCPKDCTKCSKKCHGDILRELLSEKKASKRARVRIVPRDS